MQVFALAFRLVLCLSGLAVLTGGASAQKRIALVIGNGAYQALTPLKNPTVDAGDVATALKGLGFQVTTGIDLGLEATRKTIEAFTQDATDADLAVFYYAGHGLQLNSQNFLVPIDAVLTSADDVYTRTLPLDALMTDLESTAGSKVIFLDACRNNPLPRDISGEGQDGLARVGRYAGFMTAFATRPGDVAYDGGGRNSPFAQALLSHVTLKGQSVSDMMIAVRNDVINATGAKQTPFDESSLQQQVYLSPGMPENSPETQLWQLAGADRDAELLQAYLDRYPEGQYVADATAILEEVRGPGGGIIRSAEAASDSAEEVLWELARTGRMQPLVKLYLARYPSGVHTAEAEELLGALPNPDDPNEAPEVKCERLATHERDGTATVRGVKMSILQANLVFAEPACRAAVVANPDNPHFVALLARVIAAGQESGAPFPDEAVRLYMDAAERGDARAMVSLALLNENGLGVPKDTKKAAELYERAADLGFADGAINMAILLTEGSAVQQDMGRAKELLRRASDSGAALATYNLGAIAYNEESEEAYELFLKAANQDFPGGYRYAALLRDRGEGVAKDAEDAADLILKGVELDKGEALAKLMSPDERWSAEMLRTVQLRLQAAGYYDGAIDGRRGPRMAAALSEWRRLGPPKT